jgi:hypothetical protein
MSKGEMKNEDCSFIEIPVRGEEIMAVTKV